MLLPAPVFECVYLWRLTHLYLSAPCSDTCVIDLDMKLKKEYNLFLLELKSQAQSKVFFYSFIFFVDSITFGRPACVYIYLRILHHLNLSSVIVFSP